MTITIDLNGDGVRTTALGQTQGTFDLNGDGIPVESGWLSAEDGFLVVDSNDNGVIDDISEMFGGDPGDGFAKLATFDTDGSGIVEADEILQGGLLIWKDSNENHQTDAGELHSLVDFGISSISTEFSAIPENSNGNIVFEHGVAFNGSGEHIDVNGVYFAQSSGLAGSLVMEGIEPAPAELYT